MKTSTRRIVSLILNVLIVVSTIYVYRDATVYSWRFFTNLSNVLAACTSLIMVIFTILELIRGRKGTALEKPYWVSVIRLFAAVCMTLTFVIVAIFLSPMDVIHGRSYFGGNILLSILMAIGIMLLSWGLATLLVKAKKRFSD